MLEFFELIEKLNKEDENNVRLILFSVLLSILVMSQPVIEAINMNDGLIREQFDLLKVTQQAQIKLISYGVGIFLLVYLFFGLIMTFFYYMRSLYPDREMIAKLKGINSDISEYNEKANDEKIIRSELVVYFKNEFKIAFTWMNKKTKSLINAFNFALSMIIIIVFVHSFTSEFEMNICISLLIMALLTITIIPYQLMIKPLYDLIVITDKKIKKFEKNDPIDNVEYEEVKDRKIIKIVWSIFIMYFPLLYFGTKNQILQIFLGLLLSFVILLVTVKEVRIFLINIINKLVAYIKKRRGPEAQEESKGPEGQEEPEGPEKP